MKSNRGIMKFKMELSSKKPEKHKRQEESGQQKKVENQPTKD